MKQEDGELHVKSGIHDMIFSWLEEKKCIGGGDFFFFFLKEVQFSV